MLISEYSKLELKDKAEILWKGGTHLDQRVNYREHVIQVYALFSFFVEVYYAVEDNKITQIKPLEKEDDWEGYLNSINLNHLMK